MAEVKVGDRVRVTDWLGEFRVAVRGVVLSLDPLMVNVDPGPLGGETEFDETATVELIS